MYEQWSGVGDINNIISFQSQLEELRLAKDAEERSRILQGYDDADMLIRKSQDRELAFLTPPKFPQIHSKRVRATDMVVTEPHLREFLDAIKAGGAAYLLWKSRYGNFGVTHASAEDTPLDEDGYYPCGIGVQSVVAQGRTAASDLYVYPDKKALEFSTYYSGASADPDGLLITENILDQLDFMATNYEFFGAQQWAQWWVWVFWDYFAGRVWPDQREALVEEGYAFLRENNAE
jgi:hypothetical protein